MDADVKTAGRAVPWNKGKLLGQKPPLKLKEIWAIRVRLQLAKQGRDLALFNLVIDSKLRGCDLVGLCVHDVVHGSRVAAWAIVTQKKTERPVQFEITEHTRDAIAAGITASHKGHADLRSDQKSPGRAVAVSAGRDRRVRRSLTGQHLAVGVAAEFSGKRPLTRRPAPSGSSSCISMLSNRGGRLPTWTARTQIAVNSLGRVPPHKMFPGD